METAYYEWHYEKMRKTHSQLDGATHNALCVLHSVDSTHRYSG